MKQLSFRYAILNFIIITLFVFLAAAFGRQPVPLMAPDSITYQMDAQNLLSKRVFSREIAPPYLWEPYRTPGFPLLIALSEKVTRSNNLVLFFTALMAGIATWTAVQMSVMLGAGKLGQHVSGWLMVLLPNSLGLSAFLLTDAIFGYLFLLWIYLLYKGLLNRQTSSLIVSASVLVVLQFIKPTANLGILFIVGIAILLARSRRQWLQVGLLSICAIVVPLSFATMNFRDNGVFSPSLLDIQAVREYLEVRFLAEQSGQGIAQTTEQIRSQDKNAAQQLSEPKSYYGRLYKVEQAEAFQFFQQHSLAAIRLMVSEMILQFGAPQEFAILVFVNEAPNWIRIVGSLLSILLWGGAGLGAWKLGKDRDFRPALLLLGTIAFFLITGSISNFVGARLRFPADLLAIPFFAYGISKLFPPHPSLSSMKQ